MHRFLLITACLLGLALAACGGDESEPARTNDSATQSAPQVDRPEDPAIAAFRRRVERICDDLRVPIERLAIRHHLLSGTAGTRDFAGFAGKAAVETERALSRLAALTPPRELASRIAAFRRAIRRGIAELRQAAAGRDAARRLQRGHDPFARTQLLASRLELYSCLIR